MLLTCTYKMNWFVSVSFTDLQYVYTSTIIKLQGMFVVTVVILTAQL